MASFLWDSRAVSAIPGAFCYFAPRALGLAAGGDGIRPAVPSTACARAFVRGDDFRHPEVVEHIGAAAVPEGRKEAPCASFAAFAVLAALPNRLFYPPEPGAPWPVAKFLVQLFFFSLSALPQPLR